MREYALVFLVAAAVTYVLTPLVRRIAIATHAIHEPRARDTHTKPTPLLGGLAMYGGLVAGLLVASRLSFLQDPFGSGSRTEAGLLIAGAFVVVVGFADDRWGLSALSKLAAQVAAAGILVWSGQALPWLPTPGGGVFLFEPDLSVVLTILLIVVTMNAINFIDGLDGLAAGITAVAALSFLVYSYTLIRTIGATSQSLPAVSSALLAGMCLGFLPHNFFPARIFMGDIGSMLLGLLLAYGPISSTASLAPALLTNYGHNALNRFPTLLPLLVPAAIFAIPYADLMFAIIRRTRAGKPLMAADRQHLHHRLLNIGHSYRQSVLLMYLWAALFSVTVVSLSLVRSPLAVFAAATVVAVLALLPATMPRLRPWRIYAQRKAAAAPSRPSAAPRPSSTVGPAPRPPVPGSPLPPNGALSNGGYPSDGYPSDGYPSDGYPDVGYPNGTRPRSGVPQPSLQNGNLPNPAVPNSGLRQAVNPPDGRVLPADTMPDVAGGGGAAAGHPANPYPPSGSGPYPASAADRYPPSGSGPYPASAADPYPPSGSGPYPASASGPYPVSASGPYPVSASGPYPANASGPYPGGASGVADGLWPATDRIPAPDPFPGPARIGGYLRARNAYPHADQSHDPAPLTGQAFTGQAYTDQAPVPDQDHPSGAAPFPGADPLTEGPGDGGAPFPPAPHPDSQPW
jgi:UDP-GlcNAc:undecaprenyl-phosphate GlcNAc-1-phosphate transferase